MLFVDMVFLLVMIDTLCVVSSKGASIPSVPGDGQDGDDENMVSPRRMVLCILLDWTLRGRVKPLSYLSLLSGRISDSPSNLTLQMYYNGDVYVQNTHIVG
jgi:hypothetical protein